MNNKQFIEFEARNAALNVFVYVFSFYLSYLLFEKRKGY